ncbi:type VI secretion system baseplate subunit TssE [Pseudoduganella sp. LjRoot289]|uniref:type VI secretion system baseplate subunit TssE n=1 Tax=Pseudoduganella sp. LjRoot289 TaxID=3342314 RepID=UPI003ECF8376
MSGFAPGLMDRLMGNRGHAATIVQLKDAVARDLEDLLNTRAALLEADMGAYSECAGSIVNYGLIDFAGLCLSSSEDRARICASLKRAIERHEPRLRQVQARIELRAGTVNRVDFIISGMLAVFPAFEPINFDAVLQPSTLHYSINHSVSGAPA